MRCNVVESVEDAVQQAQDANVSVLWLSEAAAVRFNVPGWEELQPHRDGAVLFINRARGDRGGRANDTSEATRRLRAARRPG